MLRTALAFSLFALAACDKPKPTPPAPPADKTTSADSPPDGPAHEDLPAVPADTSRGSQLTVSTPDEFAVIVVDGEARGTTPRTTDNPIFLPPGAHTVELRFLPSGPNKILPIQIKLGEIYKLVEHR